MVAGVSQNVYDDPDFFAGYAQLARSVDGLAGAPEWTTLQSMLPSVAGQHVVDLGCGFGWFCRWAADAGAASVIGYDISSNMLERARSTTDSPTIDYRQADLDTLELPSDSFDLAYSSLAVHYIVDLGRLFRSIHASLRRGGSFVYSTEHPVVTAPTRQEIVEREDGTMAWPISDYLDEGPRTTHWIVDGVVKQHRTMATHLDLLMGAGFTIDRIEEWGPDADQLEAHPEWTVERLRPPFLLVASRR